jgi:hypothetical protein
MRERISSRFVSLTEPEWRSIPRWSFTLSRPSKPRVNGSSLNQCCLRHPQQLETNRQVLTPSIATVCRNTDLPSPHSRETYAQRNRFVTIRDVEKIIWFFNEWNIRHSVWRSLLVCSFARLFDVLYGVSESRFTNCARRRTFTLSTNLPSLLQPSFSLQIAFGRHSSQGT